MRRSAMFLGLAALVACDPTGPGSAGSFVITPRHVVVQPGDSVVLAATTTEILTTPMVWRSLNSALASIDSLGRVVALAAGLDSIEIAASTEDADIADTSTITIATACPNAPFIAAVNLAGTTTPVHLESVAVPVDVVAGGLCAGSSTVQTVSLVLTSVNGTDRVVASTSVPQPVPSRWRPTLSFDPGATDASGARTFPAGDYTLGVLWSGSGRGTTEAALPVTIRTP